MTIGDFIRMGNAPPALRFLVIGGWAVGAHGHTRSTFDVDFLVCRDDRAAWLKKLADAGLSKTREFTTFAQFRQEKGDGFDLMFVNSETFEKMWADSQEAEFEKTRTRIPALDHLLALKVHALKQEIPERTSKDSEDVVQLAKRNRLDFTDRKYEELFLKYGSRELYEAFVRILRH